jgi:hypothetical protein
VGSEKCITARLVWHHDGSLAAVFNYFRDGIGVPRA